jgi:hypothetical protein
MRFKALAAFLLLFLLSTAQTLSAGSIAPKSKSDFGPSGLIDIGSSESSGGATLQLVCQSSTGCLTSPSDGDFLEVSIPNGFTPGELLNITGVDTTQAVWLDCDDSFIGGCSGGTLSAPQQACVTSIGGSALSSSTYQVAIASCSLNSPNTFMVLVLGLSSPLSAIPASITVTPASGTPTAPEPASWMLLAFGVAALLFVRRAKAGVSVAS